MQGAPCNHPISSLLLYFAGGLTVVPSNKRFLAPACYLSLLLFFPPPHPFAASLHRSNFLLVETSRNLISIRNFPPSPLRADFRQLLYLRRVPCLPCPFGGSVFLTVLPRAFRWSTPFFFMTGTLKSLPFVSSPLTVLSGVAPSSAPAHSDFCSPSLPVFFSVPSPPPPFGFSLLRVTFPP